MIKIELQNESEIRSGGLLTGKLVWEFTRAVKQIEVTLIWFAEIPGHIEAQIVGAKTVEDPMKIGVSFFEFPLPWEPWTYKGRTFHLNWAVEAQVKPGGETIRRAFICSHDGLVLGEPDEIVSILSSGSEG